MANVAHHTIRDKKLYDELKAAVDDSGKSRDEVWKLLFSDDEGTLKNPAIPTLAGGLDHISEREKGPGIIFHDIGSQRGGCVIDKTFEIRP